MRKALIAGLGGCVVALVIAGVSTATHTYDGTAESVAVIYKGDAGAGPGGNVDCPANTIAGPKLDPGGNYSDANLTVSNYDGQSFDWAFTSSGIHAVDMALVIVKGGPASAVYTYDFASIEYDDSDSGLTAPTNPKNGKDYGISHIQFCYDPKGGGDN
jgi:hypothetical protein